MDGNREVSIVKQWPIVMPVFLQCLKRAFDWTGPVERGTRLLNPLATSACAAAKVNCTKPIPWESSGSAERKPLTCPGAVWQSYRDTQKMPFRKSSRHARAAKTAGPSFLHKVEAKDHRSPEAQRVGRLFFVIGDGFCRAFTPIRRPRIAGLRGEPRHDELDPCKVWAM